MLPCFSLGNIIAQGNSFGCAQTARTSKIMVDAKCQMPSNMIRNILVKLPPFNEGVVFFTLSHPKYQPTGSM